MELIQLDITLKNGQKLIWSMEKTEFDNTPIELIQRNINNFIDSKKNLVESEESVSL